jgi:adenylate kinase
VGGIGGVGKTTLLQTHVREQEPRDVQLTGSSVVRGLIAPTTVEDFDRWPEARRDEVREAAIAALRTRRGEVSGRLLIDGHFTLRHRVTGDVEPIFTGGDRAFYDALVLIEAPAKAVAAWRRGDRRARRDESIAGIAEHLATERREGEYLARSMGVPFAVIAAESMEARLRELARFLDAHRPLGGAT